MLCFSLQSRAVGLSIQLPTLGFEMRARGFTERQTVWRSRVMATLRAANCERAELNVRNGQCSPGQRARGFPPAALCDGRRERSLCFIAEKTNTRYAIGSRIVLKREGSFVAGYRLMRNFAKCIFLAWVWRRCDGLALATAGRVRMPSIATKSIFLRFNFVSPLRLLALVRKTLQTCPQTKRRMRI